MVEAGNKKGASSAEFTQKLYAPFSLKIDVIAG